MLWIIGLICVAASVFLLVSFRGFHSALKQKHTVWSIIVSPEKTNVVEFPSRKYPAKAA